MAMQASSTQVMMNLKTICDALGGIATKWFKIGIQLGIPHNKLLEFQGSPDPLSAVIDYWLRGNEVESASPISWNSIMTVLKSKYVGEAKLAEKINKDYCLQETSNDSVALVKNGVDKVVNKPLSTPSHISKDGMDQDDVNLEKSLKEIISLYASYVKTLRIALEEKQITANDLRSYLLSLSATTSKNRKGQKIALLSDKKAQLQQCNTVTSIFDLLTTECTSFLNYDIFQSIMKCYNIADDKEELKYSEHLKAYIKKHKISEFLRINPLLKSKKDSKELTLKYDIETTCSLAKLEELRKLIAEIMEISISALALEIIDIIEEGCVIVTFVLSAVIAYVLFTPDTVFTPQQEEKLRAASVLWIKCNSHTFHFEQQNLQNDALYKLKEQLTCSICLEVYADPKQLQCQHAYCQQCLMGLVQQDQQGQPTLTCPTCRQVTLVPASGVAGLQADFRANQLLEILGKDKKVSLAKPQLPSSKPAMKDLAMLENILPRCPDHERLLTKIYCGTCNETICWKCSRSKHQGHFCEELDEAFARCNEELLTLSKAIGSSLTGIDALCGEISDQRIALEEEIHSTMTVDDRKTELISQLHQLTQTKLKNLAAQRDQLETVQAQLHAQLDNFNRDLNNQGEALLKKSITVKQVQKLTTTFQTKLLEPDTEADMIYLPPVVNIIENGKVCTKQSLDLYKYCTASVQGGIAIVGEVSMSVLQNWCPVDIDSISCELVSEITSTIEQLHTKKCGQCQYKISYRPTIKGKHQLHIKVEDQHIKGSPFKVLARAPVEKLGIPILIIDGVKGPQGVAVNQRGEVVVAEMGTSTVSVFGSNGKKLRIFGTHGSHQGQFNCPYGVALDNKENILVTDKNNHRIQKFTPLGEFLASVGTRGTGPLQFAYPYGITFNASNGKIYVVDGSGRIQVLNSDLSYFGTLGKKNSGGGEFMHSRHIACDSTGNMYVTDHNSCCVKVFTADGEFKKVIAKRGDSVPRDRDIVGIAIDFSDRLYISDRKNHSISVYTYEDQLLTCFGSRGEQKGWFDLPTGLAVDDCGVVYVCDSLNNRVQVL